MGLFGNKRCTCADDVQAVRGQLANLRLDFETLQDKVYRWMQRTAKRDRDAAERTEASGSDPADGPAVHPVTARILARRMRGRNGVPPVLPVQG